VGESPTFAPYDRTESNFQFNKEDCFIAKERLLETLAPYAGAGVTFACHDTMM
jgi:hypothetical protein